MCGGSPLIEYKSELVTGLVQCRGDYTGEEYKFNTLVLPSVSGFGLSIGFVYSRRGDYTGEEQ